LATSQIVIPSPPPFDNLTPSPLASLCLSSGDVTNPAVFFVEKCSPKRIAKTN